jgi:hypothetical protein
VSESAKVVLDGDVLIEIGAAIALFGRSFVLLVEDSVGVAVDPARVLRVPLQRR